MTEIPKAYEPQSVEDKWYDFWVKQGCFTADPARVSARRPAYSIVIPPPNVTGMLHMGHVLNNTIQDILSRKARMDGKEVLWLPGTDHAGIATEGMVARQLRKEEKKTKQDVGREEFLKRVWTWKEKHGDIIIQQLKKLGCSCDWTRQRFTMDPDYVRCVQKVFVDLYKQGLIYRGKRMVNWCPATRTALSDEEVEMKPQKGVMYYFKIEVAESSSCSSRGNEAPSEKSEIRNPMSESSQSLLTSAATKEEKKDGPEVDAGGRIWLTIATTRPETIPGDTAIAVNPKDPRYTHLIGKHVIRPLPVHLPLEQKLIPIIGDEHVEFTFGTGVLKVTPAHDKADFEIGQRHGLAAPDIMNPDGTMNELAGESLAGLDRFEARSIAVERLKELGALVKEEPYENNVGFSQRADVPIEPRLSEQWFLKYPAVEQSKECVEQCSTGDSPVPPGDPPGGTDVTPEPPVDARNTSNGSAIPVGGSPTGTGGSPVPPNRMRFHPPRWAKVYDHWLTNIQDWCISRQLWWGHRIPVWTLEGKLALRSVYQTLNMVLLQDTLGDDEKTSEICIQINGEIVESDADAFYRLAEAEDSALDVPVEVGVRFCTSVPSIQHNLNIPGSGFSQDLDVLDTWFSSWLWPFATMGWPEQTPTLKAFYPTADLVTGPDIIFFWVARMIMAGYEFMGDLPFRNVYFTGIIRDKQGRKMSKTLGNSPDPLELIAKYGADALRFGTMRSAPLGQDVLFDEKDVELGRNFCNKLWNACRFRQMQGIAECGTRNVETEESRAGDHSALRTPHSAFPVEGEIDPALLTADDKWILLKLDKAVREIDSAFAGYRFNEATQTLYRFFWNEYCDWYTEASKAVLQGADTARKANKLAVIDFVLSHTLRLFHPFLPFISEELWHGLGYHDDLPAGQGGETIMYAHWPKPLDDDFKAHYDLNAGIEAEVSARYGFIAEIRNLRSEKRIPPNKRIHLVFHHANRGLADSEWAVIQLLAGVDKIDFTPNYQPATGEPVIYPPFGGKLFMPLEGLIDVEAEKARLTKELARVRAEIEKVQSKLNNPKFTQNAAPRILEEHRQRLTDWEAKLQQVESALNALAG